MALSFIASVSENLLTSYNLNDKIINNKILLMYPSCVWQADRRKQVQNLRGTAAVSVLTQLVDESRSLGNSGKAELGRVHGT